MNSFSLPGGRRGSTRRAAAVLVLALIGTAGTGCSSQGRSTTVVFSADQPQSGSVLTTAAGRMLRRARMLGISGATAKVTGQSIALTAKGDERSGLLAVGTVGLLYLRPVVADGLSGLSTAPPPDGTVPPALESAFNSLLCRAGTAAPTVPESRTSQIVACAGQAQDGQWMRYVLDPVVIAGTDVASAVARNSGTDTGWEVDLDFDAAGARAFAAVTQRLATLTTPGNQIALEVDGSVLSAPAIASPITGGKAVISGTFDQAQAQQLAAQLSTGSIPAMRVVSTETTG